MSRACGVDGSLSRQREPEYRSLSNCRLNPDLAAVLLDDSFANRQSDAGPGKLAPMQTLEYAEGLLMKLGIDLQSVVAARERDPIVRLRRRNVDARLVRPAKLDRIRKQLPEQLAHLCKVEVHLRKRIVRYFGGALANRAFQSHQNGCEHGFRIHPRYRLID